MANYLTNQSAGVRESAKPSLLEHRDFNYPITIQDKQNSTYQQTQAYRYNTMQLTVDIIASSLSSEMHLYASAAQMQWYCRALVCPYTVTVSDEAQTTLEAERCSQPPNQSG